MTNPRMSENVHGFVDLSLRFIGGRKKGRRHPQTNLIAVGNRQQT